MANTLHIPTLGDLSLIIRHVNDVGDCIREQIESLSLLRTPTPRDIHEAIIEGEIVHNVLPDAIRYYNIAYRRLGIGHAKLILDAILRYETHLRCAERAGELRAVLKPHCAVKFSVRRTGYCKCTVRLDTRSAKNLDALVNAVSDLGADVSKVDAKTFEAFFYLASEKWNKSVYPEVICY
jgi:hypothetical protein